MKKLTLLLLLLTFAINLSAQSPRYRLVWKEDFNGKHINEKFWTKIPRGKVDWNRHMSAESSLYEVSGGSLKLHGVINQGLAPQDTARFLTGGVYTHHKKTLSYGKVEVRAKIKGAQGAWPAIWMLPDEGIWPDGGEIDIMERLNRDSIAYQTVHTYYTYVLNKSQNPPHGSTGRIDPDGYNVYAVEILPDSLVFSINGKQTFSYPRIKTTEKGQYPFGTPFYLLIDMQIEGSWVGSADPHQLPATMEIDWVKFYKLQR